MFVYIHTCLHIINTNYTLQYYNDCTQAVVMYILPITFVYIYTCYATMQLIHDSIRHAIYLFLR